MRRIDLIHKAKLKWCINGNKNIKLFHGVLNGKRKKKIINMHEIEGVRFTNLNETKEKVWKLFASKFDEDVPVRLKPINSRFKNLSPVDHEILDVSISLDEIRRQYGVVEMTKPQVLMDLHLGF